MTEEQISEVLPSIAIARLFYEYGRLDAMLKAGFDSPDSEIYMMFWELIDATADFVHYDYDEGWNVAKWYFSNEDMVEYYRLCRTYSALHGMKLKDNPYMQEAQRFVETIMDFNGQYGYAWYLCTRVNHKWASGLVFRTDEYFNAEYDLLEALLTIGDWYTRGLKRLRGIIEEEKRLAAPKYMEVMAA